MAKTRQAPAVPVPPSQPLQLEPGSIDPTVIVPGTGCSAAEVARMLQGRPIAGFLAKAARPLLAVPPADLTAQIVAAGVPAFRASLANAYAEGIAAFASAGAAPEKTEEGSNGDE
jgi:hypothetical protein